MPDLEERKDEDPAPKKQKPTVTHVIAFALVGILIVLTLSNLKSILSPIQTLNAILAPITVGLVIAYIVNFLMRFFECKLFKKVKKRTVTRGLSMLFAYLLLLLIIAGIVLLIIPNVIDSVKDLQANSMLYITRLIDSINAVISKFPVPLPEDGSGLLSLEKLLNLAINFLSTSGSWIVSNLATFAGSTITVLKNALVGIFISIYVLFSKERLNAGCRRVLRALFSEKHEKLILHYCGKAHNKFGGYMIGKLIDSTMVMLVCMLLFTIFRIPYAILIAVIVGVTDIIPFFGPFLGAIPSAIIIFIASPWKAVVFVLLILVVQQIDGNLIAPAILGDKTGLTSLGVIIAVTVMGGLLGITGMLIGVPLFALIMTLLDDYIKHRLKEKGHATDLKEYYPADAFIRPQDINTEDETLTQRFVHWVCTVETEKAGVDFVPSRRHTFGRGVRIVFLTIGRFFHKTFSVKPIPADNDSGIFTDITQNGMRTNRLFWHTFIRSIVTIGVYPFCLIEIIAQSTNVACYKDGKRTWGFSSFLLLTVVTLGIFPIVWHCGVISRMQNYCAENDKTCPVSKKFYLCWTLVGLPTIVGPLIAIARFLRGFSTVCEIYNEAHTFPLTEEEIEAEKARMNQPKPQKHRKSLIEQINEIDLDEDIDEGIETEGCTVPDAPAEDSSADAQ